MAILAYTLLIINILIIIYNFSRYISFCKKQHSDKKLNENFACNTELSVIIPCLREHDMIENTIKYFIDIFPKQEELKTNFVIVTNKKERIEKQYAMEKVCNLLNDIKNNIDLDLLVERYGVLLPRSELQQIMNHVLSSNYKDSDIYNYIKEYPVTHDFIKALIAKNNYKITLIEYPYEEGFMAHQLNYAVDFIQKKENIHDQAKRYIAIYNADSRPAKNTFYEFIEKVQNENAPKVMQQYSAMTGNIEELNPIMKGFAIYQTEFEIRNGYLNSYLPSKLLRNHVVGHGLFIETNFLKEIGGFNTDFWCEDIYLSFYLRNLNIFPSPFQLLEKAMVPSYLKSQIHQHSTWFKTAFQPIKIAKYIKSRSKLNFSGYMFCFQQLRSSLAWLLNPLFMFVYIFLSLIVLGKIYCCFATLILFIRYVLEYFFTIKITEKLSNEKIKNKFYLILCAIFATLISNWGPIHCLMHPKRKKEKTNL